MCLFELWFSLGVCTGMVTELVKIKGERPAICADINIDLAVHAFEYGGVEPEQIVKTTDVEEASAAIRAGKYVATNDSSLVTRTPEVDVVVDVTGVPDVGARIALDAIAAKKHIIMMNVESDVVIGIRKYFKEILFINLFFMGFFWVLSMRYCGMEWLIMQFVVGT